MYPHYGGKVIWQIVMIVLKGRLPRDDRNEKNLMFGFREVDLLFEFLKIGFGLGFHG